MVDLFDKLDTCKRPIHEAVIAHVTRYRVSTLSLIKMLFFSDDASTFDAIIDALLKSGKLKRIKGKSAFAIDAVTVPGVTVKADGDLAKLWFCCSGERRYLLGFDELRDLFSAEKLAPPYHNLSFCLAFDTGMPVLLRLYLCVAEKKSAREQLKNAIGKAAKSFAHWGADGSFGVAVMVTSDSKKTEIEKLLATSYGGNPPLNSAARFVVEVVATPETYPEMVEVL